MLEELSIETIERMLDHLPIEISLVDADDTIRYYSHGENRIFRKTPAVIGRKVQNCHPQNSVHKVQQILDDFKAAKRDVAQLLAIRKTRDTLVVDVARYTALRWGGATNIEEGNEEGNNESWFYRNR